MYNQSGTLSIANKECLAYSGKVFVIEWYYNNKNQSQSLNYYNKLSLSERIKMLRLIKLIGDFGKIHDTTKFNYEGSQIFAFKPQPHRFLCFFFCGKKIIITNAFRKNRQKLPVNEKEKAIKYKFDFETRINTNNYYEKCN